MSTALTIANISTTVANFSYSQAQDWSQEFYSLGGNYSITAYSHYLFGSCTIYLQQWINSAWTTLNSATATGFNGATTATGTLPGQGYYKVYFYDAGTSDSQSGWCTVQQNGMPRYYGQKLRKANSNWSGYESGTAITDADISAGRIASFN